MTNMFKFYVSGVPSYTGTLFKSKSEYYPDNFLQDRGIIRVDVMMDYTGSTTVKIVHETLQPARKLFGIIPWKLSEVKHSASSFVSVVNDSGQTHFIVDGRRSSTKSVNARYDPSCKYPTHCSDDTLNAISHILIDIGIQITELFTKLNPTARPNVGYYINKSIRKTAYGTTRDDNTFESLLVNSILFDMVYMYSAPTPPSDVVQEELAPSQQHTSVSAQDDDTTSVKSSSSYDYHTPSSYDSSSYDSSSSYSSCDSSSSSSCD